MNAPAVVERRCNHRAELHEGGVSRGDHVEG